MPFDGENGEYRYHQDDSFYMKKEGILSWANNIVKLTALLTDNRGHALNHCLGNIVDTSDWDLSCLDAARDYNRHWDDPLPKTENEREELLYKQAVRVLTNGKCEAHFPYMGVAMLALRETLINNASKIVAWLNDENGKNDMPFFHNVNAFIGAGIAEDLKEYSTSYSAITLTRTNSNDSPFYLKTMYPCIKDNERFRGSLVATGEAVGPVIKHVLYKRCLNDFNDFNATLLLYWRLRHNFPVFLENSASPDRVKLHVNIQRKIDDKYYKYQLSYAPSNLREKWFTTLQEGPDWSNIPQEHIVRIKRDGELLQQKFTDIYATVINAKEKYKNDKCYQTFSNTLDKEIFNSDNHPFNALQDKPKTIYGRGSFELLEEQKWVI